MKKTNSKLVTLAQQTRIMEREPIIYDHKIAVRFADLDPYNHVNASVYLDYIASARLTFLEETMKVPIQSITERNIGFYLKKVTQEFKRPIMGLCTVRIVSFVEAINFSTLTIPYALEDQSGSVYSEGVLEYAIVDLTKQSTCEAPNWVIDFFLKPSTK
jgi:acyl-CoA thioesterase FadM